jgi:glyoxylase-like metal-dependent hydrolase (beta-lactamase superfamily II)
MEFFQSYAIDEGIICIIGITGELMYLVEGKKKGVLIDTGLGAGNIMKYIHCLTSKPYIVLLTHGHFDHIGGAFLYDYVYINSKDITIFKSNYNEIEHRANYINYVGSAPDNAAGFLVPSRAIECLAVEDGDIFDLGGLTIETISTPGHTEGSLSFLIRERRIILLGDACNNCTFLFLNEALTVEQYQKTLIKLMNRENEFDRVLISHWHYEAPKTVLKEVYDCCADILNGTADETIFSFMDMGMGYSAKKLKTDGTRKDGVYGNIIYRKDKIFQRG